MKRKKSSAELSRRNFIRNTSLLTGSMLFPSFNGSPVFGNNTGYSREKLNVKRQGDNFILDTPYFAFCLDTTDGLKALWWLNKLTGRKLNMGKGKEVDITIGLPGSYIIKPKLIVTKSPATGDLPLDEAVFELYAAEVNARFSAIYRWNSGEPVMTKVVRITNEGAETWNRLLDIHLGTYTTDAALYKDPDWPVLLPETPWGRTKLVEWEEPAGRIRGYPSYPENQFFVGLAHPSGFSLLNGNKLELHHHPGIEIESGIEYSSMQAVYGVAPQGGARTAFKGYVLSRMRRVLRGHDHPYAIIDTCGSPNNTGEKFDGITEEWSLQHISELTMAQVDSGMHFDNYVIEFWHDPRGDLKQCDRKRFPDDFDKIAPALNNIGTDLGLWISSGYSSHSTKETMDNWTIGANPELFYCSTTGDGKGRICRSTPPVNQMYIDAFIQHIRKYHIRQIKLDSAGGGEGYIDFNRMPVCNNSNHKHLPGIIYSVEANHNAQIELLNAIDKECPEVFLTLYWGHHSPWWLLFGDTVYDIGLRMEMASAALSPALFGRSSNVRVLDQGKYIAAKDYPDIAWDTLGIALSDWTWNNRLGSEKWQEGVLMDLCRGSMLLHIWSDNNCIPENDRPQMAEFIDQLKASPDCFRNPHSIGNPFKDDWWGYCCTDGKKAMIAIDNGSWEDQLVTLELNPSWGLPDGMEWDIYGWYPYHTKFRSPENGAFGAREKIIIRPFTAILLEIVPRGHKTSLEYKNWKEGPVPLKFRESSKDIELSSSINEAENGIDFSAHGKLPSFTGEGWLAVTTEFIKDSIPFLSLNNKPYIMKGSLNGDSVAFEAALDNTLYSVSWQTYRLKLNEESSGNDFQLSCNTKLPKGVDFIIKAHFIPIDCL